MSLPRPGALRGSTVLSAVLLLSACGGDGGAPGGGASASAEMAIAPDFRPVQPDLFSTPGGQPNAWADYDKDGDLDLFVGFRGGPNRLYRNDEGTFVDVAAEVGLADVEETRAAAWGDFDGDGDLDLYVGFAADAGKANRLYRNDGGGAHFTDVAPDFGMDRVGTTRQPVWVDYDGDGDVDLFVAFRDQPNRLYRSEGGQSFTDVTESSGIGDPRKTVGAVWFDMDGDADLDLFVANQDGDEDGVFRNNGDGTFTDVAADLGMNAPGRAPTEGGVGVAVADYDNDGDLDLFEARYGPDALWQNQGDGTFVDVAPGTPLAGDHHSVSAAWGDYDNDGRPDLYVATFLSSDPQAEDHLFRNTPDGFEDVTPPSIREHNASHGVSWADFDLDGDLDLALAENDPDQGADPLYMNALPDDRAASSLAVAVLDGAGRWARAGAIVTLRAESGEPGHPDGFQTSRVVDSGGGYSSQGALPVHFGIPPWVHRVSVSVTWFERGQPRSATVSGVDPAQFRHRWAEMKLGVQ